MTSKTGGFTRNTLHKAAIASEHCKKKLAHGSKHGLLPMRTVGEIVDEIEAILVIDCA